MYFSDKTLADLHRGLEKIPREAEQIEMLYLQRAYKEPRAREFAHHGFVRRVKTLVLCAENVFALLPPELTEPPESETRKNVEINIQASVFTTFGAIDNLAWIWATEKGVTKSSGSVLHETDVGFRKQNRIVRRSLPDALQDYLENLDEWFARLENFRHALAHRIPLYIPPYVVLTKNAAAYEGLEGRKAEALAARDYAEYDRLKTEQRAYTVFRPWMLHSFFEESSPMEFHPQLIANFNTVAELARMLLDALDA